MSEIRCYPGAINPRLRDGELCFELDDEFVFLTLDGDEKRREPRKTFFTSDVGCSRLTNWDMDHGSGFLLNGCKLKYLYCIRPSAFIWELRAPTGLLLTLLYDPSMESEIGLSSVSLRLNERMFLIENTEDIESIILVRLGCTLAQWSPEIDHLFYDRDRLRTWMLVAKRLELDPAIARKIALLC